MTQVKIEVRPLWQILELAMPAYKAANAKFMCLTLQRSLYEHRIINVYELHYAQSKITQIIAPHPTLSIYLCHKRKPCDEKARIRFYQNLINLRIK